MSKKDEKHPLLVVLVDQGDEPSSTAAAAKGDGGSRGATSKLAAIGTKGRERAKSLASGTVNIIKLWPDHLTTYTLTLAMIILTIILLVNISVYFLMTPGTDGFREMERVNEECLRHNKMDMMLMTANYRRPDAFVYIFINNEELGKKNIYSVKNKFAQMTRIYERFHLNSLTLINDTDGFTSDRRNKRQKTEYNLVTNDNNKRFNYLHPRSLSEFFDNSPLEKIWFKLSHEIVPFAVMVISLWEHGGLSVDLEKFNQSINQNDIHTFDNTVNTLDDDILYSEPYAFKHFNSTSVNNIQDIISEIINENNSPKSENNRTDKSVKLVEDNFDTLDSELFSSKYFPQNKKNTVINKILNENYTIEHNANTDNINNSIAKSSKDNLDLNLVLIPVNNSLNNNGHIKKTFVENPDNKYMIYKRMSSRRRVNGRMYQFLETPKEDVVLIDLNGMFISVKVPCHAFLGQLIQQMHTKVDYITAKDLIEDAFLVFCQKKYRKGDHCKGVDVIVDNN